MKNIKKGSEVLFKAKELISSFSQAIGLMFQKPKPVLMIFKKPRKTLGIHMMFCFWPLDLVFLNQKKQVVEIKECLKPFRFYTAKQTAKYLIETPNGFVKKHKLKVKDQLSF